jgi:tetratricopeptide (TPR) repeat protein
MTTPSARAKDLARLFIYARSHPSFTGGESDPDAPKLRLFLRPWLFALFLALISTAYGQSSEIRVTGEYTGLAGDSPQTASKLATLDARRKAVEQVSARLGALPAIVSMKLSAETIRAYAFGMVHIEVQPVRVPAANSSFRVDASSIVDPPSYVAAARLLRRDVDTTSELLRLTRLHDSAWAELQRLSAADRVRAVERLDTLQLVARSAALGVADRGFMTLTPEMRESRARARKLAEEALAIIPASVEGLYRMGDLLLLEGKPELAEKELRAAISLAPGFAPAHAELGNVLAELERYSEAAAEYREALRLDPKYVSAYAGLGNTLKAQRRPADAIAQFREAIRVDASFVDGHNNLGIALANEEQFAEAAAAFREVIRLDPESALGHYNLALALASIDKEAEAIAELREAVRLSPGHYNAHYQLGERLRLQGELADSAKAFKEFLRLSPEAPELELKRERAKTFVEAFEEP